MVGLMKLQRVSGQPKYAVAIEDEAGLWLALWVSCNGKGEIFVLVQRDRSWDPHFSYHIDGTLHGKTYRKKFIIRRGQPLTADFRKSEHLGKHHSYGTKVGAICNPAVFDEVMIIEPGVLTGRTGSIGVDLVAPGYEETWKVEFDGAPLRYGGNVYRQEIFRRGERPSIAITIER